MLIIGVKKWQICEAEEMDDPITMNHILTFLLSFFVFGSLILLHIRALENTVICLLQIRYEGGAKI